MMDQINRYLRVPTVLAIAFTLLLGVLIGSALPSIAAQSKVDITDTDEAFQVFWEAFNDIQSRYVEDIPIETLVRGAISGMVGSLDDQYSNYMDPDTYAMFNTDISGNVEGIGVVIRTIEESGAIEVVNVLPNAPAEAAGVLPGDVFHIVDGESVAGLNQMELAGIVRGPAGTDVTITFLRDNEPVEMTITRARFEVPNVESQIVGENIAYLSVADFSSRAQSQVRAALEELDVNARDGLILDLRGNPGGLLSAAVDLASLFVDEGTILYEVFGDGSEQVFSATGDSFGLEVPLVILIDEASASASELVSGALRELGAARLVGETTFGKGTVQTIETLSDGSGLRLTIAKYLLPNRQWIHEIGVVPDVEVLWDRYAEDVIEGEDPQLDAAIDLILSGSPPSGSE